MDNPRDERRADGPPGVVVPPTGADVRPPLGMMAKDLRDAGVKKLIFLRGSDVVRAQAGDHNLALQTRDGTVIVLDRLAVRIIAGPHVAEPGTAGALRAAGLRTRESDPPAARKTGGR